MKTINHTVRGIENKISFTFDSMHTDNTGLSYFEHITGSAKWDQLII